jgi:hypothetical protein
VITLTEGARPGPPTVAAALGAFIERPAFDADAVDRTAFEAYSARESTRALAAALDLACERQGARPVAAAG